MLRKTNALKQILQIDECKFRKSGKYGDRLMSILRNRDEDIKDGVLSIRTNLIFNHQDPCIKAFNSQLRFMRRQGIVMVNVMLD